MPKVTFTLNDEVFQKLAEYASQEGIGVDEFLSREIHHRAAQLFSEVPKAWMPREQWDALVRGEQCPLCAEITSQEPINEYGYTVADLGMSRLRLGANQFVPGYCVLICKKHVQEMYHLTLEERSRYVEDLVRVAQALDEVFHPLKMNFLFLGNAIPHLHCHIIPRFYGDAAPGSPLDPNTDTCLLSVQAYEERVHLIRASL
jgi:diadenosine tetraphosphate (Ap4A) HIT family hydrolase